MQTNDEQTELLPLGRHSNLAVCRGAMSIPKMSSLRSRRMVVRLAVNINLPGLPTDSRYLDW